MITQVQIKDSELEKYESELSDYLDKDRNRRRIVKMYGGNTYWWKKHFNERMYREKYAYNSFVNVPLHLTEEIYNEEKDLLWRYD
jgi:hypothetical protein